MNLYPFEETIAKPNTTLDIALENIDIGGVTLIRYSKLLDHPINQYHSLLSGISIRFAFFSR